MPRAHGVNLTGQNRLAQREKPKGVPQHRSLTREHLQLLGETSKVYLLLRRELGAPEDRRLEVDVGKLQPIQWRAMRVIDAAIARRG